MKKVFAAVLIVLGIMITAVCLRVNHENQISEFEDAFPQASVIESVWQFDNVLLDRFSFKKADAIYSYGASYACENALGDLSDYLLNSFMELTLADEMPQSSIIYSYMYRAKEWDYQFGQGNLDIRVKADLLCGCYHQGDFDVYFMAHLTEPLVSCDESSKEQILNHAHQFFDLMNL